MPGVLLHVAPHKTDHLRDLRRRRLGLPPEALRCLKALRAKAEDQDGYVFTPKMAGLKAPAYPHLDPDYFDNAIFGPVAEAAGLGSMRFHDLRHFYASKLIEQGETALFVKEAMGHSSLQITFDTYGHLWADDSRPAAAAKLGQSIFGRKKTMVVPTVVQTGPKLIQKRASAGGRKGGLS